MEYPTPIPDRRAALLIALVLLASASLVLLRLGSMPVGASTDDAYYVEMARSLAEGRGPVIHLHDETGPWPPDVFPPGFPLLLAPLARLVPESLGTLKIVPLLAWVSLIPLCLAWPGPGAPWSRRLALTALVMLNPWTIGYAGRLVSDLPYTALSLGALLAFRRWRARPGLARLLATAALTVLAVSVRTVGWVLPAAMVLSLLLDRRGRSSLSLFAACGLPLAAIHLAFAPVGAGLLSGAYADQVLKAAGASRFEIVTGNFAGYLAEVPALMLPVFGAPARALADQAGLGNIYSPILAVLGACFLGAAWLGSRRGRAGGGQGVSGLYAILTGLALINFAGWPSGVQTRLLLPLLPLLMNGILGWFDPGSGSSGRRSLLLPVFSLLLAAALFHNGFRIVRPVTGPRFDPGLGAAWLKENSAAGETVLVRLPLKQHLHLDRPTVGWGERTPEALERRVARFDVRWILIGPEPLTGEATAAELAALLAASPERYPPVHEDPGGLFRIHRVENPQPRP